jgi:hypothetical protein
LGETGLSSLFVEPLNNPLTGRFFRCTLDFRVRPDPFSSPETGGVSLSSVFVCGFKDSFFLGSDFLLSATGLTGADEVSVVVIAAVSRTLWFSFLCGDDEREESDDFGAIHDRRLSFREKLLVTEFRTLGDVDAERPFALAISMRSSELEL